MKQAIELYIYAEYSEELVTKKKLQELKEANLSSEYLESTYNYVRYFNPQEVKEIAKALSNISEEKLEEMCKNLGILSNSDSIIFLLN